MVWSAERLQDWFADNDVGELEWEQGYGNEDSGYVIEDYEQHGYDRRVIKSCFTYNKKDASWKLLDDSNGVKWVEHQDYDARARIADDDFKFFIPRMEPPRGTDITEYGKYQELKAILAGRDTPLGGDNLDPMDDFLHWHLTPRSFPVYP
jgi:uncharacterized protein (UPF0335 family)